MGHVELDFSSIPKLYGPENFWHWHMLLRAYLDANELWRDDHPRDNPHAKFIILATVQTDKIEPGFDEENAKQIFKTLEERFRPNLMGSFSSRMEIFNINVPDIPKLSDSNNYWNWRILVRAYLEAMGLWAGQAPVECPQSKFILLSTIEFYLITRDYELKGAVAVYQDLYLRFGSSRIREL